MLSAMFFCAAPALASVQPGAHTPARPASQGALTLGMRGPAVRALQHALTAAGVPTAATGYFDTVTYEHVVAFQRRYRLGATGVVSRGMLIKLHELAVARAILRSPSPETAMTGAISPSGAAGLGGKSGSPSATAAATGTTASSTTSLSPTSTTQAPATPTNNTGGIAFGPGPNSAPMQPAVLQADGLAIPPAGAPQTVRQVIAGGDMIAFDPYIFGGGHQSFNSPGYDCSGSVSFALHVGGLLASPLDSTQFETWGKPGPGRWITLWANGGHVFMEVAGLFFDTAAQTSVNGNDRWSLVRASPATGFVVRHPSGW
jgi:peptidoglycan hydrolase-like protein with peptidoglycan-binding domain